jgi:hypothetical protein
MSTITLKTTDSWPGWHGSPERPDWWGLSAERWNWLV